VTDAARHYEKLARVQRHGAAVRISAADVEETTEDKKHLVLMIVRVPGEFALHLGYLDVLIVDLTNDSRRPQLCESGTRKFKRDGGLLPFESGVRRHCV
jgi:hypothetical protein